jgi:hypothetical protein
MFSAHAAFAGFLQAGNLKAGQMTFINQIILHLEQNHFPAMAGQAVDSWQQKPIVLDMDGECGA